MLSRRLISSSHQTQIPPRTYPHLAQLIRNACTTRAPNPRANSQLADFIDEQGPSAALDLILAQGFSLVILELLRYCASRNTAFFVRVCQPHVLQSLVHELPAYPQLAAVLGEWEARAARHGGTPEGIRVICDELRAQGVVFCESILDMKVATAREIRALQHESQVVSLQACLRRGELHDLRAANALVQKLAGVAGEGEDYADVRRRAAAGISTQVEVMRLRLKEIYPREVKYNVFVNKLANVLLASQAKIKEIIQDEDGGEEWRRLDLEIGWLLERYKDFVLGRSQTLLVEL